MSATVVGGLQRRLERVALEHARRPSTADRSDLVADARELAGAAAELRQPTLAAVARLREGEILLDGGDADAAAAPLRAAADALTATSHRRLATVALARLSDALTAGARDAEALAVCAAGIDLVEQDRSKVNAPYLQAGYLRRTVSLYDNGVRAAHAVGDERLLAWSDLVKSRVVPGDGDRVAHDDVALIELETALAASNERIERRRRRDDGAVPVGLLQHRRVLFDRFIAARRGKSTRPKLDLHGVRAALAPDQRVVSYAWVGPEALMISVVGPDGVAAHHLQPVDTAARAALGELTREVLGPSGDLAYRVRAGRLDRALQVLAPVLLPPPVRERLDDAARLLISPHRALHAVPFHALPDRDGPLIRRFATATVPNLTSLQVTAPPAVVRGVVAVGVNVYAAPGVAAAPLRHAEAEVAEVARRYRAAGAPTTVVLGAEATEEALRRRLGEHAAPPAVVHLALHGASIDSDTPLESWLLLADSKLDGIDLTHWRLDGATVVLSACSSGQRAIAARGMAELPGDDLFGLQAAFFASGARQVVGALWPVNDRVARRVTAGLHTRLIAGATADVALRGALVDLLDGSALYGAVNYWAPWYVSCLGAPATLPTFADRQEPA